MRIVAQPCVYICMSAYCGSLFLANFQPNNELLRGQIDQFTFPVSRSRFGEHLAKPAKPATNSTLMIIT